MRLPPVYADRDLDCYHRPCCTEHQRRVVSNRWLLTISGSCPSVLVQSRQEAQGALPATSPPQLDSTLTLRGICHSGGGNLITGNLLFNTGRAANKDEGSINTWDRAPYITEFRNGTASTIPAWNTISKNFLSECINAQLHLH